MKTKRVYLIMFFLSLLICATACGKGTMKMNFEQIKKGDYTSIQGDWEEVEVRHRAYGPGMIAEKAKTGVNLQITEDTIRTDGLVLVGDKLTTSNNNYEMEYAENKNALVSSVVNEDKVAINWSITFYPKGTTSEYRNDDNSETNTENLIVIWTSNNQYTQVFAPKPDKISLKKTSINLSQIANNDFSSLQGLWRNKNTKETMSITNQTQNRPEGSNVYSTVGVIIAKSYRRGYPQVITSGEIKNGYIQGAIGSFDPEILMSPFTPLIIVPKGIKISDTDDSDVSQDRMIVGGGQGGYATQAYYKEEE